MPTKTILICMIVALVLVMVIAITFSVLIPHEPESVEPTKTNDSQRIGVGDRIRLPEPSYTGNLSVEEALSQRRSIRAYSGENLTINDVSQLLWAAQGITSAGGGRTAPSAGALYPLELYLVVGDVEGIDKGVYKYIPEEHELEKVKDGDTRTELADAALGQACVRDAAIDIVFTAVYEGRPGNTGNGGSDTCRWKQDTQHKMSIYRLFPWISER